jgi:hypothetical protein
VPSVLYSQSSQNAPKDPDVLGPQSYIASRAIALKYVAQKSDTWKKTMTMAVWNWANKKRLGNKFVWRKDMVDVVGNLLRDAVVKSLRWQLVNHNAGCVERLNGAIDQVGALDGVACVLYTKSWTGSEIVEVERTVDECLERCTSLTSQVEGIQMELKRIKEGKAENKGAEEIEEIAVPRLNMAFSAPRAHYPTVPYKDRIVPVYNLEDLLGPERTKDLLASTVFEASDILVLKESRLTVNAQLRLLQMQGFLS